MRVFKTKTLAKFARQNGVSDASLVAAVRRATQARSMQILAVTSSSSGWRGRGREKEVAFAC